MVHANGPKLRVLLIAAAMVGLLAGCASKGAGQSSQSSGATPAAAAVVPELPAPKKAILIFEADSNRAYEILGEVDATVIEQGVYNYEGAKDQAREHLKRVAYAKYGDRLDAIISYREVTTVGGGGFWGVMVAAYGAKNTDVKAKGVAIHFTGSRPANGAASGPSSSARVVAAGDTDTTKGDSLASKQAPQGDARSKSMSNVEVQKRLLALGYKAGTPDGVMAKRTVEALKKFQTDNQLAVTGLADEETVAKLAQKAPGTPARSASTSPAIKGAAPVTAGKTPAADL